jgi:hypothetical protein
MTGTLHEDQYTFMVTSRSVLLRIRNVSDRRCRENQNNILRSVGCLIKSAVYEIMRKNIVQRGRPQMVI